MQVEVKRAIPRSRITPNGTLLSPCSSPGHGHKSQWAPAQLLRSQTDIGKIYSMEHQPLGIANAKLRQELRRSASVGNPSMLGSQSLKPSLSPATRQGLEAAIAAVNSPSRNKHNLSMDLNNNMINHQQQQQQQQQINLSQQSQLQLQLQSQLQSQSQSNIRPNVITGPSYAAALRARGAVPAGGVGSNGGVNDDSEASHTDQMLIASLQADLFDALSKANNSPNDYLRDAQDSANVIKRPPRSLSEPVIQMPGSSLSSEYFQSNLISRIGVGALGGVFNPQQSVSPSMTFQSQSTGNDNSLLSKSPVLFSPMTRSSAYSSPASRSPLITSMSSSLPLSPFSYAWLSSQSTDAVTSQSGQVFFPPLNLPASTSITGTATDRMLGQRSNNYNNNQYVDGGELNEGLDNNNSLLNPSLNQNPIQTALPIPVPRIMEESIIPSPSAWASMLMAPTSPQALDNHLTREQQLYRLKMLPMGGGNNQGGSSSFPQGGNNAFPQDLQSAHDYPYLYEQHHQQLQQQQQRHLQLQQRDMVNKGHYQQQPQQQQQNFQYEESVQFALNNDNEATYPTTEYQSPNRWTCQVGPGVGSCVGSGMASRSGSFMESLDPQSSSSGVTDKDELFTLDDMRLDGLSPECEAQTSTSTTPTAATTATATTAAGAYQPW